MSKDLSAMLATPGALEHRTQRLRMVMALTWPAVMAEMSTIIMEYIDAAMVGSLGATQAAAIGLVATSTWLVWGLAIAAGTGFSVQVAHLVGARNGERARAVLRQALWAVALFALVIAAAGVTIAPWLPHWLGGHAQVCGYATHYFRIFSAAMPMMALTFLATGMLRSSGNMVVPGAVNVCMCLMDVVFNYFLIFDTRTVQLFGHAVTMPGAGMGVPGAALGTALAYSTGGLFMLWYAMRRSPWLSRPFAGLSLRAWFKPDTHILRRAVVIAWPVGVERTVMCGAQILITAIVAPLGNAAIAANAFAVTAESLCYTPGFGVADAATTLVGQSLGAGRRKLAMSFARISIVTGMVVMTLCGAVMWILAPEMMGLFTTDTQVLTLGVEALRIEAWAEPMFAAAIVTYGVFVGAGYTKMSAVLNFGSIWVVRLSLSAWLAPILGLRGVWIAMCIELCVRGTLFLISFMRGRWMRHIKKIDPQEAKALLEAE